MSKTIVSGMFVQNEKHPDYGVGRVLSVGTFVTRVLFPRGGMRVFRAEDTARLTQVAAPSPAEQQILEEKEAAIQRGTPDLPKGEAPVEVKPAKKRAKAK